MGTWGPAIFSDDLACDIRDRFREELADGASTAEAVAAVHESFGDSRDDPQEGPTFWIALAAVCWTFGRLDDDLKARAIKVIECGADLERWDDLRLQKKRAQALDKLATKLRGPQPKPKMVKRFKFAETGWQEGEVLGLQSKNGDWIVLYVIELREEKEGLLPIIGCLDWAGRPVPPNREELAKAKMLPLGDYEGAPTKGYLVMRTKSEVSRFVRWGVYRPITCELKLSSLLRAILPVRSPPKELSSFGVAFLEALFEQTPTSKAR